MSIADIINDQDIGPTQGGVQSMTYTNFRAFAAICTIAKFRPFFTTDDIWFLVEKPSEPRAIGGVLNGLARQGVIRRTDHQQPSRQKSNHGRPVRVWESLVFPTMEETK